MMSLKKAASSLLVALSTLFLFLTLANAQSTNSSSSNATYTNPILNKVGADPWVIRHENYYYMTYTTNDNITILRSPTLTNWDTADVKLAFAPPAGQPYSTDLWAPELHLLNNTWYIIFTADPSSDTPSPEVDMYCPYNCPAIYHRMYVLEGTTPSSSSSSSNTSVPDPWTATFTLKAQLNTYDQFAIDGTYFAHTTGLYHIYSCWYTAYSAWPSNLCITRLSDPWTVSSNFSDRAVISVPSNPWEKTPYGRPSSLGDRLSSNEGPEQLVNPRTGQQFVVYSAARSDNRNYCLGLLELVGEDPMDPGDWRKKDEGCVFWQNPREQVYGVGHASFVNTGGEGEGEDWIVYHGMQDPSEGWSARTIRAQRFGWDDETGEPVFPRPGVGPFAVPS